MLCCLTRFRFTIQRTQQKIILILRRLNRKLGCGCVFVATGNGRVHEVPSGIYGVNSGRHLMKLGGTVGRGSRVGWNRWVEAVGGAEPGGTGGWGSRAGRRPSAKPSPGGRRRWVPEHRGRVHAKQRGFSRYFRAIPPPWRLSCTRGAGFSANP